MPQASRYSLRQLIAVTTAVAAALVLAGTIASPPLANTGLREARLPALVLLVAIWFCGSRFTSRMVYYAGVGALFAVPFCLAWLAESDPMFGHYHGPPQWIVVATVCAGVSAAACLLWFATSGSDAEGAPSVLGRRPLGPSLGMGAVMAASVVVLLIGNTGLRNFDVRANHYIEQRLLHKKTSVRQWADQLSQRDLPRRREMASLMASHYLMPDDVEAIPTLARLLDDPDVEIRRNVARTIAKLVDDAWRSGRLASAPIDPDAKAAIARGLNESDAVVREELTQALLRIEPAAVVGPRPAPGSLPFHRPSTP